MRGFIKGIGMTFYGQKYFGEIEFSNVYCRLIEVARKHKIVNYREIAQIMVIPQSGNYMSRETGQILGEISQFEHKHKRPLLSAVVVRLDLGVPGKGFFDLSNHLGRFKGGSRQDKKKFWEQELQTVYATWG